MAENSKRELSTSSVEDSGEKRQKMEEEMSAWAKNVFSELLADVAHTKNNTNKIVNDINDWKKCPKCPK